MLAREGQGGWEDPQQQHPGDVHALSLHKDSGTNNKNNIKATGLDVSDRRQAGIKTKILRRRHRVNVFKRSKAADKHFIRHNSIACIRNLALECKTQVMQIGQKINIDSGTLARKHNSTT